MPVIPTLGTRVLASVHIPNITMNKVKLGVVVSCNKHTARVAHTHKGKSIVAKAVKYENIFILPKGFRVLKKPRLNCVAYVPIKNRVCVGKVLKITPQQVDVYIKEVATVLRYRQDSCLYSNTTL